MAQIGLVNKSNVALTNAAGDWLIIESEPGLVVVPSIIGLTEAAAINALASVGLNPGNQSDVYSDIYDRGLIATQVPAPGLLVQPGTLVDYSVSVGVRLGGGYGEEGGWAYEPQVPLPTVQQGLFVGGTAISSVFLGAQEIEAIYLGGALVWSKSGT